MSGVAVRSIAALEVARVVIRTLLLTFDVDRAGRTGGWGEERGRPDHLFSADCADLVPRLVGAPLLGVVDQLDADVCARRCSGSGAVADR